ncbi:hypothetical protein V2I01_09515 [Micromonospora sp. BRA006-A]|nr:hypothetical protein [Micromonospora sp. BRA006-A]
MSVVATVGGALVALLSFGMLTWLVVLLYGVWRRGWGSVAAAVCYLTVAVTFAVVVGGSETEEVSGTEGAVILIWLTTWVAGVPHVVLLNGRLLAWLRGLWRGRPYADRNRLRRSTPVTCSTSTRRPGTTCASGVPTCPARTTTADWWTSTRCRTR